MLGTGRGANGFVKGIGPVAARRCDGSLVIVSDGLEYVEAKGAEVLYLLFSRSVVYPLALCRLGLGKFPEGEVLG